MKRLLFLYLVATLAGPAAAQEQLVNLENLAGELVEIRQLIENLHEEIRFEKDQFRDQLRSYASQKSDLDVRISRAELGNIDLQRELDKLSEITREKNASQQDITPILKAAIADLQAHVEQSLPFQRAARQQALADIDLRYQTGVIAPNKAANQLWAFVEDELLLGRTSGLYNDTLRIDGREQLVKVLRLGKVAMYYRTQDGRFGVTRMENGEWRQVALDDAAHAAQLETLFDSFNKNIRNRQFELPNFLPRS